MKKVADIVYEPPVENIKVGDKVRGVNMHGFVTYGTLDMIDYEDDLGYKYRIANRTQTAFSWAKTAVKVTEIEYYRNV